jgi:hypothetical protein
MQERTSRLLPHSPRTLHLLPRKRSQSPTDSNSVSSITVETPTKIGHVFTIWKYQARLQASGNSNIVRS